MTTVYLEPNQVPAALKGAYTGRKFRVEVRETMRIPSMAGIWDGGSRETYRVVRLSDGATINAVNHNAAPWDNSRQDLMVSLESGIAVVKHSIFCGKDMGLTFYLHPSNAAAMLPAPAELTDEEKIVLTATRSLKSSYNGKDRYEMSRDNAYPKPFMTREQWESAKQSLMARGFLNKAGAITTAGRNACPSRY